MLNCQRDAPARLCAARTVCRRTMCNEPFPSTQRGGGGAKGSDHRSGGLHDVEWSAEEQALLEVQEPLHVPGNSSRGAPMHGRCAIDHALLRSQAGMQRFPSEKYSSVQRYIKIAATLPEKGVRDVALRIRWMSKNGQALKKRRVSAPASHVSCASATFGVEVSQHTAPLADPPQPEEVVAAKRSKAKPEPPPGAKSAAPVFAASAPVPALSAPPPVRFPFQQSAIPCTTLATPRDLTLLAPCDRPGLPWPPTNNDHGTAVQHSRAAARAAQPSARASPPAHHGQQHQACAADRRAPRCALGKCPSRGRQDRWPHWVPPQTPTPAPSLFQARCSTTISP